ncbi:MAG: ATP-binding cassette domain-containing protein [Propionibacteriales bacterium]|nr:ATP-binding cassette domain-containing protein [Propionibacteriales bacterium]
MLTLEDVESAYGRSLVLRGVSLSVEAGEVVCLLGRNGAGKTTTLRSIVGLVRPRSGHITFDGTELVGRSPHRIARLGLSYVPDDRRIFAELTVEENLRLARRTVNRPGDWDLERVYHLFPVLEQYRRRGGAELSGGEQKMLATGRALIQNPRLLLLDEASEGLAPKIVQQFVQAVREISATGIAVLLADQNLKFARRVAGRGYVMGKGTIEHADDMYAIWANEEVVRRYLSV